MAKLCTLRLLHQLNSHEASQGYVKCVAFAAPALGNAALATLVQQQGWSFAFYNLTLPGEYLCWASMYLIRDCNRASCRGRSSASMHGLPAQAEAEQP